MNTIEVKDFTILTLLARPSGSHVDTPSFQPHSIRRESDGEVFTIGDLVTNGTQMTGKITGFSLLGNSVYVDHTWSGVGMWLENLKHVKQLPSKHQRGDRVKISIRQGKVVSEFTGYVLNVHFFDTKVKYDLEIPIYGEPSTRFYNIDECFLS